MGPTGIRYCTAKVCHNNNRANKDLVFHRFPKDPERSKKWIEICGRPDLLGKPSDLIYNNYALCDKHFGPESYTNPDKSWRLVWDAIPTLFLTEDSVNTVVTSQIEEVQSCDANLDQPSTSVEINKLACSNSESVTPSPKTSTSATLDGCPPRLFQPNVKQMNPERRKFDANLEISGSDTLLDSRGDTSNNSSNSFLFEIPPGPHSNLSLSPFRPSSSLSFRLDDTPRKVLLKKNLKSKSSQLSQTRRKFYKLKRLTYQRKTVTNIINDTRAATLLTEDQLRFFETQMKMSSRCKKGRRWNAKEKEFALSIFYRSRTTYKALCKMFFFPSISTLQRWISKIKVNPGLENPGVFLGLAAKSKGFSHMSKFCIMMLDEISITSDLAYDISQDKVEGFVDFGDGKKTTELCNHALVVMLQGLFVPWKQPLAFFYSSDYTPADNLEKIVKDSITKVTNCDLHLVALVNDQAPTNRKLFSKLGISEEKPYFKHDGIKVFGLFDVPHLFKSLHNCMMAYDLTLEGKTIKWKYIYDFFKRDSSQPIRLAPKLTADHLDPEGSGKMKVKIATQALSYTSAAALMTYVSVGLLPAEAAYTAHFIEKVDKLFDAVNCSEYKSPKPLRRPLTNASDHLKVLKESAEMLRNLKIICGKRTKHHFVKGWLITISAVIQLWEHIQQHAGAKYFFTRRLNQDALENFFAGIRCKGGFSDNPSASKFRSVFKLFMVSKFFSDSDSRSKNCEDDDSSLLLTLQSLGNFLDADVPSDDSPVASESSPEVSKKSKKKLCPTITIGDKDAARLVESFGDESIEQNTFHYVVGSSIRKVMPAHKCDICGEVCVKEMTESSQLFTHFKAYTTESDDFGGLTSPSENVMQYMLQVEKIFIKEFNQNVSKKGLRKKIMKKMEDIECNNLCSTFKANVTCAYVRMRIYYAVKFRNAEINKEKLERLAASKKRNANKKLLKIMHLHC